MFLWDNVRDTYQIQLIVSVNIIIWYYDNLALYDDRTLE